MDLTDEFIDELITLPKRLPRKNWFSQRVEFAYLRLDVLLECDSEFRFTLKGRCSQENPQDFSAILSVKFPTEKEMNLLRCNGAHVHGNNIEKETLGCQTHIHKATRRYIAIGANPEKYAVLAEDCYNNYEEAILHLLKIANISQPEDDSGQQSLSFRK
ncbi:MAG: hypothetical protein EOM12_15165 [Verrucomicrobiae bacterium]|nr:hypothetical protein [Verrucomicrobiae bacterium]